MASFVRPLDPSLVDRVAPDETFALADPDRTPGEPIIRPRVARYAGSAVVFLQVSAASPFEVRSPVTGSVRNVDLDQPLPAGVNRLVEISPLPFSIAPTLAKLQPGVPTFYLAYAAPAELPDDVLAVAAEPIADTTRLYVGAVFQDGVSLAPWAWIDMIGSAMANSDDDGAAEWNTMAELYDDHRNLRVLDHTGRPAAGQTFQIRIRRNDGLFDGIWVRSTGDDGDLEAAVAAEPLDRPGALQPSLFGAAGEQTELLWRGAAPDGDISWPVQALYGTGESAAPGVPFLLPAGSTRGHLQLLELASWFADPPDSVQVARFHANSRVEPLVDGKETFRRLVADLLASDESGAHFAGWAFKDFPLVEADELPAALGLDDATFSELIEHLVNNDASVRFLVNKFITFEEDPDTEARLLAAAIFVLFIAILAVLDWKDILETDWKGYGVFGLIAGLALFASASKTIEELAEQSLDIFPVLNEIRDGIAVFSEHPARLDDNPVKETPITILELDRFIDRFGTWHQKFQCFKLNQPNLDGDEFVAYLGGIDINDDRLDTPGHQIGSPYHDVHARVTGRGVADLFRTFEERWGFETDAGNATLALDIDTPAPGDLESDGALAARHIVQIARTHFQGPGGTAPFTNFAEEGERTIHDTLVRAIRSAKDYIYIEDQYFVPNDRQNPADPDVDLPDTVLDALVEAAQHCRRLIILVPSIATIGNQPFSHLRRDYAMSRLRAPEAWGDRVLIGAPMRRPVLAGADRTADEGRCILMSEADANQDFIVFGPPSRVPGDSHFWLWVDGELMLSKGPASATTNADGQQAMRVEVLRGQAGNNRLLNASTRRHFVGAPVTLSRLHGIFVHAKIVVIDDVFVSIGSANMNRRSFFYDGEINVFAVPEQLKGAKDNPARALRTALWAEQLNLPPAMGPSLLGDPMAAFELFRRSHFAGNRFMNLQYIDLSPDLAFMTSPTMAIQLLTAAGITWANSLIDVIWNSASDPTSFIDPDPTPGPTPDP